MSQWTKWKTIFTRIEGLETRLDKLEQLAWGHIYLSPPPAKPVSCEHDWQWSNSSGKYFCHKCNDWSYLGKDPKPLTDAETIAVLNGASKPPVKDVCKHEVVEGPYDYPTCVKCGADTLDIVEDELKQELYRQKLGNLLNWMKHQRQDGAMKIWIEEVERILDGAKFAVTNKPDWQVGYDGILDELTHMNHDNSMKLSDNNLKMIAKFCSSLSPAVSLPSIEEIENVMLDSSLADMCVFESYSRDVRELATAIHNLLTQRTGKGE